MTDDKIKEVFEEYGRVPLGKEYALIHAIAEAVAPQRTWIGLKDEDFLEACQIAERGNYLVAFQRIQAKLKDKNT
jgi:hypothetical protein